MCFWCVSLAIFYLFHIVRVILLRCREVFILLWLLITFCFIGRLHFLCFSTLLLILTFTGLCVITGVFSFIGIASCCSYNLLLIILFSISSFSCIVWKINIIFYVSLGCIIWICVSLNCTLCNHVSVEHVSVALTVFLMHKAGPSSEQFWS